VYDVAQARARGGVLLKLATVRTVCRTHPLTLETHERALEGQLTIVDPFLPR